MVHDKSFMENADLKYFDREILDIVQYKENEYLFKIGNSFLVSLKAKYSPKFFEENGMPQSIGLQLQFKENFALDRSQAETH